MTNFEYLEGPYGVPVYFQQLPSLVNPVSLRWVIPVGAADDESVGDHGLYHWFEHVPFRGTKKYPGGSADTADRFARYGGDVSAYTSNTHTTFWAYVPKRFWCEALDVISDLVAQPLMTAEAINAEREIIYKEIGETLSDSWKSIIYRLQRMLWSGHPLGHPVLGSESTLSAMNPDLLRRAHAAGYDRSRCTLFVAGDVKRAELMDAVAEAVEKIPDRQLSPRRTMAHYGRLPVWQGEEVSEVETSFSSSTVCLLFPVCESNKRLEHYLGWSSLTHTLTAGGLSSPLMRILREERRLVYDASAMHVLYPDGGYWGLFAETKKSEVSAVLEAFWDVIRDPELISKAREEYVHDSIRAGYDMQIVNPHTYTEKGETRLLHMGKVISDDEVVQHSTSIMAEDILDMVRNLTPDHARTIIFQGTNET